MDALTTLGLWRDDAQVVSLVVQKTFGPAVEVGARIAVATLAEPSTWPDPQGACRGVRDMSPILAGPEERGLE
jgi:hypothetical protein